MITTRSLIFTAISTATLTGCDKTGSEVASTTLRPIEAGADILTNKPVTLNGKVSAEEEYTTVWTASSSAVIFGDESSLTSSVSAKADGTYVVTLTGTTASQVVATDELTLTWDTTAPLPPVLNRTNGSKFSGTLAVAVVNEKATDFQDYRYTTESQELADCNSGLPTRGEFSITSDHDITIKIAACDAVGNMSQVTQSTFVFEAESGPATEIEQMYAVTPAGTGVTVTPSGAQTVAAGDTLTFNVAADAGFVVAQSAGGDCPTGSWNGTQYTTGAILADCSVSFNALAANVTATASGQVNSYAGAPAFSLTIVDDLPGPVAGGQTKSFTVTPPTPWHVVSTTVDGSCAPGSWAGNVYTTGPLTENCTVQFAAGTGSVVSFAEVKALMGKKSVNSSVATSSAVANTSNSSACINCHKAPESTSSKPSAGFAVTATASATVSACGDDACRSALVDYAKLTDNIKYDTKLVGSTTSGSAAVTLATTTGLSTGLTITGTGIPSSTTVSSVDSATQITISANATATGRAVLTFGVSGAGLLQESPVYCTSSSSCSSTVYKRVDPGSPLTSHLCLKVRASVTSGAVNALDMSSLTNTGGVTLGGSTTPKTTAMPNNGPNFLEVAEQDTICRWILQGANNI